MSSLAITGKSNVATLTGVATLERMQAAHESRELQAQYVTELVTAYRDIDTLALQVDGAKALHGAYIYRNLEELSERGKVTVDGETVPLGTAVAKALGKVSHSEGVKPLSSGSATRYKYISRIYFDAGIREDDPDYADIVNYYVSDSRLTTVLKYSEKPANLTDLVREAVKRIRAPKPVALPTDANVVPSTATVSDETPAETPAEVTDSQGPENGEPEATVETREAGPIPAHEIDLPRGDAGKVQYAEAAIAGLTRANLTPDLLKRLTVLAESIALLVS